MKSIQYLGALAIALILVACGGGSSNDSFGGGGNASLSVNPASSTVTVNTQNFAPDPNSIYTTPVSVRFRTANGQPIADGTSVTLTSSNASRGVVSPVDQPEMTGSSATSPSTGGQAQFWFTAGEQTGTVTLTASAANPSGGVGLSATAQINVEAGAGGDERLTLTGPTTIPSNEQDVPIFLGSPYISEVNIRYTGPNGEAGSPVDGQVAVAISPVSRAAFSTLDDPETEDINEFFVLIGNGPVNMAAGQATVFVHSDDQPGPVTLTVSATDATTGEQFTETLEIQIEDGAANSLPSRLDFNVDTQPTYVQGAGGNSTKSIQLAVFDAGDNPIPDPESDGVTWNNVRLQLEAPQGSGARLVGTGASGSVEGTDISVRTVNGIAGFALNAGSEPGTYRIIATVDRADNNVDQGITDPLVAETTVEVGDGQLFALEIVSPILNSININSVAGGISAELVEDDETGLLIPADPDGTYSLRVTVQGTDQIGNPTLPGTTVNFGKIDDPLVGPIPRVFTFSGGDGDPEEGGTLFSAFEPFEGFLDDPTRVDEAVEAGDTVALFGKLVPGNRQHEAVRFVASTIDENTVSVVEPFNPNNQSGSVVDDGPVIPWVIGRSNVGTIEQSVVLDETGRGSVQLTYPINSLGRPIVLWTQGTRVQPGGTRTVADVEGARFPGIRPVQLSVSPSTIQANNDTIVRVCLRDAALSPIEGAFITGGITEGPANGTLDGSPMTTTTGQATGTSAPGCVDTLVNVSGLPPTGEGGSDGGATLTFSFDTATADVTVIPPGAAALLVEPSVISDSNLAFINRLINLTLIDGSGQPIVGTQLLGECETDEGVLEIAQSPGVTDQDGETTARVLVGLAGCGTDGGTYPRLGTCTFTTNTGSPVGVLQAFGIDVLSLGVSPPPAGCPDEDEGDDNLQTLVVQVEDNRPDPQPSSLVESIPSGISCDVNDAVGSPSCEGDFQSGTTVTLRAPTGSTPLYSGACTGQMGSPDNFGEVDIASDSQVCVVTFN